METRAFSVSIPRRPAGPTRIWRWVAVGVALLTVVACGASAVDSRPDVLLVVWDTVRSDRMSLCGHERPTTPWLEELARDGRVFTDALAVSPTTAPSHASIFTGLLPREHLVDNNHPRMPDTVSTLAQLLAEAGYRTLLYSANPYLSEDNGFTRGFESWAHPWDPERRDAALAHVLGKVETAGQPVRVPGGRLEELSPWYFKDSGDLARDALVGWLAGDDARPFFAVVNLMEAHTWRFPADGHRRAVLGSDGAAASYGAALDIRTTAEYVFGLRDLDPARLELEADVYDATLHELDTLSRRLVEAVRGLDRARPLVIVLTSDHGEHLGEHRRLNHQFSLYRQVLEVPLLIVDPTGRIAPGTDHSPVTHLDLFATVLATVGVDVPAGARGHDLAEPLARRDRLASYTDPAVRWIDSTVERHPEFDPAPFTATLDALHDGRWKLITSTDGRRSLFDLEVDPEESTDRWADRPDVGQPMLDALVRLRASLDPAAHGITPPVERDLTPDEVERLRALGYAVE